MNESCPRIGPMSPQRWGLLGLAGLLLTGCGVCEAPRWTMWTDGPGGWSASLEYTTLKDCERGIFPGLEKYAKCLPYGVLPR